MEHYTVDNEIEAVLGEQDEFEAQEFSKILNVNKTYKASRDYIIKNSKYTNEQKIKYFEFLDVIFKPKAAKIQTSNYDGKPYVIAFFNDFLDFINEKRLTPNELKICLSIYSILNETNTYGNVLISVSNTLIASKTKLDKTNVSKAIKTLC